MRRVAVGLLVGGASLALTACERTTRAELKDPLRSSVTPDQALTELRLKARNSPAVDPRAPAPLTLRRADVLVAFWTGNFDGLEAMLAPLLAEFERSGSGPTEETLHAAVDWLARAPEAHTVALQWVQQFPNSHFARALLGHALVEEAYRARGGAFGSETTPAKFEHMREWIDRAVPPLAESISSSVRPVLSVTALIRVEQSSGKQATAAELADLGLRLSPHSKEIYSRFLSTLQPQWNGSLEEMQTWVERARAAEAPDDVTRFLSATTELAMTASARRADQRASAGILEQLARKHDDAWLWKSYGDALHNATRAEDALLAYTRAIDTARNSSLDARYWRARGLQGVGKMAEAVADFEIAARAGHYQSQEWLIQAYAYGNRGLPRDVAKLRPWCELAATHGNGWGDFCLGGLYFDGLAGIDRSAAIAVSYFEIAARKGHAVAQHDFGWMLVQGRNVAVDRDTGVRWLRASAAQGTEVAKDKLRALGLNPSASADPSRWDWLSKSRQ